LGKCVLDKISAVSRNFSDQVIDAFNGVVQQIAAKPSNRAIHDEFVVRVDTAPFCLALAPKTGAAVRVPVTMPDPATAAERASRKIVGRVVVEARIFK